MTVSPKTPAQFHAPRQQAIPETQSADLEWLGDRKRCYRARSPLADELDDSKAILTMEQAANIDDIEHVAIVVVAFDHSGKKPTVKHKRLYRVAKQWLNSNTRWNGSREGLADDDCQRLIASHIDWRLYSTGTEVSG